MRIVLTGGGTAGHVTPNLALIEVLEQKGWRIDYMGSFQGIEKTMMEREGIPYHGIQTGKLRRYWTWKNLLEPIKVFQGFIQAYQVLRKLKPNIVFSKGGFVAFPVVLSAWVLRIPVVAHESDLTPGLANRLSFPFVSKLCVAFDGAKHAFRNQSKVQVTGTPIREALFKGKKSAALKRCGFDGKKPVLLVVGGSLGAKVINEVLRSSLPVLCKHYHVIHLCGKGKLDSTLQNYADYFQCEYAHAEMADFLAASDLVISRAGANSVYELLALNKLHIFIPLSKKASRGDQIQNAYYFEKKGVSLVLDEERLTSATLLNAIEEVEKRKETIKQNMASLHIDSATERVIQVIESCLT